MESDTMEADTMEADTMEAETVNAETMNAETMKAETVKAETMKADAMEMEMETETETGKIKVSEVIFDPDLYPREKWNSSTVNIYADSLQGGAKFPPLILQKGTNILLDGVHRWKSIEKYREKYEERKTQADTDNDRLEDWALPQDEVEVEYHIVPDGIPIKLYAASLSTRHGERITPADRKALAREIFEENPDFNLETLTRFIDVSKSTAANYVADIRARRKEAQKMVAYRLHRLGWTMEEIGETINLAKSNVSNICSEFPDLEKQNKSLLDSGIPHLDVAERFNMPLTLVWAVDLAGRTDEQRLDRLGIKIQPYDVWNFIRCHELFGNDYPGRIPGELIAHVLYFFTEPGDMVLDPMAGSGSTLDVCLAMGRKCYGYDIDNKYQRSDIIKHDLATAGWPERVKKANLIFWDPPYFEKIENRPKEKSYIDGSISKLSREEYLAFFTNRLSEASALVKKGTRLAFLMSDWDDGETQAERKNGETQNEGRKGIFLWDYANIISRAGWRLVRHIQVPLSTQQIHPDTVLKFRKSRRLARLERYLLVAEV